MYVTIPERWRHMTVSSKSHWGKDQEEGRSGGKLERELSKANTRVVSGG